MPVEYRFKHLLWESVAAWSEDDNKQVTTPPEGENDGSGKTQS